MIRYHYITLFLLILSTTVKAQNIEFIENKGQWDDHVKFRSEVPAGSFFIRKGGFTVLQHNKEDLKQVQEYIHGRGNDQDKRRQGHYFPGNEKSNAVLQGTDTN